MFGEYHPDKKIREQIQIQIQIHPCSQFNSKLEKYHGVFTFEILTREPLKSIVPHDE